MSVTTYLPYYPDLQNLSAAFNSSGTFSVQTKFRRVYGTQCNILGTSSAILAGTFIMLNVTTNAAGQGTAVAGVLMNASTFVSSAYQVNVWVTGTM